MIQIVVTWIIKFLIFFLTYVISSRIISIPIALALKFPHYIVFFMVFTLDIMQIHLFNHVYGKGFPQIPLIKHIFNKLPTPEKVGQSFVGRIAEHLGGLGLIFISAVPTFGGGIWSAVLLAHVLRIRYGLSFVYISIGSFLSCFAVVYGFNAIFRLIGILQ